MTRFNHFATAAIVLELSELTFLGLFFESSTSSNSSGSGTASGSNTLSFEDFYKLRERDRQ